MPRGDYDYLHATSNTQFLALFVAILVIAASLGALVLFGIILD